MTQRSCSVAAALKAAGINLCILRSLSVCLALVEGYSPTSPSVIFPIVGSTDHGRYNAEVGRPLSLAFNRLVDSTDFLIRSIDNESDTNNKGHSDRSSCRIPLFGEAATLTFQPRQSTFVDGTPTEFILEAKGLEYDEDFGWICTKFFERCGDFDSIVGMTDLREKVTAHCNILPPHPGYDAELTSAATTGNQKVQQLIEQSVDAAALRKLKDEGFVVIDNIMSTSASSNDGLSKARTDKTDQDYCRTDSVVFLDREEALGCGIGEQYDLLLALASFLNDNYVLDPSPYKPLFPGTTDRPLSNPKQIQFAEYGVNDFYAAHSDNSIASRGSTSDGDGAPQQQHAVRSNYRSITCILYANEGWEAKDGGALRMYLDSANIDTPSEVKDCCDHIDVNPANGRLLIFDSRMVHSVEKVLNKSKVRRALTLWIIRPEESGAKGEQYYDGA